jgi:HPt (histidine-containing phosphotransfer) domain-containing protein
MDSSSILNPTTVDMLRDLDGGSGFFADLVQEYVEQADRLLADMSAAHAAQDASALQFAVHTLKGSSFNIGAEMLGQQCASLERLQSDQYDEKTALIAEIRDVYAVSIDALNAAAANI